MSAIDPSFLNFVVSLYLLELFKAFFFSPNLFLVAIALPIPSSPTVYFTSFILTSNLNPLSSLFLQFLACKKSPAIIKILHGIVCVSICHQSLKMFLAVLYIIGLVRSHAAGSLLPSRCFYTCPVGDMCGASGNNRWVLGTAIRCIPHGDC